jgi:hypothetical protein
MVKVSIENDIHESKELVSIECTFVFVVWEYVEYATL